MSSSEAMSNTLDKSTPWAASFDQPSQPSQPSQPTQEPPQTQAQEPPTETAATNEGAATSSIDTRKRKTTSDVWNHFTRMEELRTCVITLNLTSSAPLETLDNV
ncbi:hypothetical protein PIB30_026330 [Stylosanthes scabra]|uniref:Uncharacterized protein n=1 Tax=Stylosanthes scabra TaxID=79078 RepID=A0ABU6XAF7_9FABA|nr:hypothetical protein [Stylosanthes scabra]